MFQQILSFNDLFDFEQFLFSFFYYFFICLLISLICALFGVSLGFRKLYVNLLLKIFEFGKQRIENELHNKQIKQVNSSTSIYNLDEIDDDSFLEEFIDSEEKVFHLDHVCHLITKGIKTIVDDEVTKRFDTEELPSWNLLTRTNKKYTHLSVRLTILWGLGCLIRYVLLCPARIIVTILSVLLLIICTAVIGCLPESQFKRTVYWHASLVCFRIMSRAFSGIITFHDRHNMAKPGGITVANHTSPIDVAILACDNCYALVGQKQGGFLGVLQSALTRASNHIWFDRFEIKDKRLVVERLRSYVNDPYNLPILIFPEGTCINNSAVMMFKKGSFEIASIVYPVAIKYDSRFGDPFWNSHKHGYMYYLMLMMTSWAIVCDVWYLPPMIKKSDETAIQFANRVKAEIAKRGGLVDLQWDGQLKRLNVKEEWKEKEQEEFSKKIKVT
ncbi:Glycerol-3-phosphate acyltransferase 4 [Sarcoptes scabiei]|uniref:Glycerol-3-phosphate acyltransferase 4 n=1 Tax=Sarcoptes scabiei TaxID=52283 RepID=A0A834RAC4_SARSC|nr:Glycerol-3-phosphate acyltransferase 4 [Sarcoptes scabiei]UXI20225.1 ancient ubiquitous protein 1-like [Sarcoptes scabiei]